MKSKYFSNGALKALNRIGDLLIPKNGEFPAFSEAGGLEHVDELAASAPTDDIKDLNLVLGILAIMPGFILKWVVNKMENAQYSNGPLSSIWRQLDFGLRGLIFSCYYTEDLGSTYTGPKPLDIIGYSITRIED